MNNEGLQDGQARADPSTATTDDLLRRLIERVEHIDRTVSRLERAVDAAPPLLATAVDVIDDSCRRMSESGAGPDQRLGRVLKLAERLTDDDTARALDALLNRSEALEGLLATLESGPGLLAVLVDTIDESAARLAAQGIDPEVSLRQGLHALLWLGQQIKEPELERLGILLQSPMLDPQALAVIGKAGEALATYHENACEFQQPPRIGPIGVLRVLREPDVQRSLAFVVQVARCFGRNIAPAEGR